MALSTGLTIAVYVAFAVVAWTAILVVVPANLQAMLRHRLWQQRDQIYDDMRTGALPVTPTTRGLLVATEAAIANTREVSFGNIVTSLSLRKRVPTHAETEAAIRDAMADWSPAERDLFWNRSGSLGRSLMIHMLFGTPSGWLALPFVVVLLAVLMLVTMAQRFVRKLRGQRPDDPDRCDPPTTPRQLHTVSDVLVARVSHRSPTREELEVAVG